MIIRAENIQKGYILGQTILPVLRGVSFELKSGEFVSITGSSGCGKSTLLHVLSGLDVPQKGQVYFNGIELFEPEGSRRLPVGRDGSILQSALLNEMKSATPPRHGASKTAGAGHSDLRLVEGRRNTMRNSQFGFVFQFYHLLPEFDVLENVLLPAMVGQSVGHWLSDRRETWNRAHDLLNRMGLGNRLHHRPNELSGGERQRVAIARALINKPHVLFADEPTGNLDSRTGRDIFSLLKELNRSGQTVVMVTHDRELAHEADRVVHLVDGRIETPAS